MLKYSQNQPCAILYLFKTPPVDSPLLDGSCVCLFKDGAYFCYCAYVLHISRYSIFLWVVPTNTGIFLRGLKLCGESRT